jgi:hypothetical protein
MLDPEKELQARQFKKLLLVLNDFGNGAMTLGRFAGSQKILKTISQ